MDEKMHGLVRWLDGPIDGCLDEWVDGWIVGWMTMNKQKMFQCMWPSCKTPTLTWNHDFVSFIILDFFIILCKCWNVVNIGIL